MRTSTFKTNTHIKSLLGTEAGVTLSVSTYGRYERLGVLHRFHWRLYVALGGLNFGRRYIEFFLRQTQLKPYELTLTKGVMEVSLEKGC